MGRFLRLLALASMAALLSGCLAPKMYVDTTLPAAGKTDVRAVGSPQPVQFLYEFQTRGSANARATENTRERLLGIVRDSGLFASLSGEPQANQRRLTVVINNVPITKDAAAKGFGVGLTFGLAGTTVTDGYECTAVLTTPGAPPLTLQFQHAIHTTIGNTEPPAGLVAEPTIQDAVTKMVNQLMWSIMRDLSRSNLL